MNYRWFLPVLTLAILATACGKEEPKASASAPSPSAAPASPAPSGPAASEKHRVWVSNYPKTPVTVTVNGEWVGQWDSDANVPLTSVVKGKNELLVEAGGEPKAMLTVAIQAERGGQWVSLLSMDFNGKPGKHSFAFGAK